MPHVSRKQLSLKILRQILNSFIYVLTDTKNKERMAQLLDAILSDTEKIMLAKRLAIIYLLSERVGKTEIAETLNVTRATVDRMQLWYETKGSGYKVAINKLRKEKLLEGLKILAIKATNKIIRTAAGHT